MKNEYKRKTLRQLGKELEKKMLGPFVYVYLTLV